MDWYDRHNFVYFAIHIVRHKNIRHGSWCHYARCGLAWVGMLSCALVVLQARMIDLFADWPAPYTLVTILSSHPRNQEQANGDTNTRKVYLRSFIDAVEIDEKRSGLSVGKLR